MLSRIIHIWTLLFFLWPYFMCGQVEKDRPITYEDDLSLVITPLNDSIVLYAKNKLYSPLEIVLSNPINNRELNSYLVPPLDSLIILRYQSSNLDSIKTLIDERFKISYYLGHADIIQPDEFYLYQLPYAKKKKVRISQGWNGPASHRNHHSRYAYDFVLQVGEPIYAAREGIVVKVVDWFTKQGGPELRRAANKILVLHDDGTRAVYVHLDYQGALVKEGDRVEKGQKIGISGLTGYTTGPHLHFVVRKERDIAIPIYFQGYKGKELKAGKKYRAK